MGRKTEMEEKIKEMEEKIKEEEEEVETKEKNNQTTCQLQVSCIHMDTCNKRDWGANSHSRKYQKGKMNEEGRLGRDQGKQEAHASSLPSSGQLLWAGSLALSPRLPPGEHRNSSLYVLILLIFKCQPWNSLAVQWLGLSTLAVRAWAQSLVRELRTCKSHCAACMRA